MENSVICKETFKDKPWYEELCKFTCCGVCKVSKNYVEEVRKALLMIGYEVVILEKIEESKVFIVSCSKKFSIQSN